MNPPCPIHCLPFLLALLHSQAFAAPSFQAETIDAAISIGYGLAIGDLNGDQKPDIFLADAKEIVCYTGPDWRKRVLAKGLSPRDNVCLAVADLDGDGKAELAAGANWNPGNSSDPIQSGSTHFLVRPSEPDALWNPVNLPHEPTVHRMHWVRCGGTAWSLVVQPLHGRDSKNGVGPFGSRINSHLWPGQEKAATAEAWPLNTVEQSLRITHNFDLRPLGDRDQLLIGGKEGIVLADPLEKGIKWKTHRLKLVEPTNEENPTPPFPGCGEIRFWNAKGDRFNIASIEPFHGNLLVAYRQSPDGASWNREIIDEGLRSGHALACADFLGAGSQQIVAGWREPDADGKVGIKLYWEEGGMWKSTWLANNTIACEDLKAVDADGDGDMDVVAAGRATKNVLLLRNSLKKS